MRSGSGKLEKREEKFIKLSSTKMIIKLYWMAQEQTPESTTDRKWIDGANKDLTIVMQFGHKASG